MIETLISIMWWQAHNLSFMEVREGGKGVKGQPETQRAKQRIWDQTEIQTKTLSQETINQTNNILNSMSSAVPARDTGHLEVWYWLGPLKHNCLAKYLYSWVYLPSASIDLSVSSLFTRLYWLGKLLYIKCVTMVWKFLVPHTNKPILDNTVIEIQKAPGSGPGKS